MDESGPARFGYGSMLAPAWGLPVEPVGNKTLRELFDSEENGFTEMQGPDM